LTVFQLRICYDNSNKRYAKRLLTEKSDKSGNKTVILTKRQIHHPDTVRFRLVDTAREGRTHRIRKEFRRFFARTKKTYSLCTPVDLRYRPIWWM
ncbi:hypothetical protein PZH44_16180, partial [Alistipes putredinis]|uniref:hypothetical protein n=1 Tax=Alistipes putredinis TaxID=28117 RepID=UPI0023B0E04E